MGAEAILDCFNTHFCFATFDNLQWKRPFLIMLLKGRGALSAFCKFVPKRPFSKSIRQKSAHLSQHLMDREAAQVSAEWTSWIHMIWRGWREEGEGCIEVGELCSKCVLTALEGRCVRKDLLGILGELHNYNEFIHHRPINLGAGFKADPLQIVEGI